MSVWTQRIDSLNDQYKKLEKVLNRLNDLKERAENTWYIDPKGLDNINELRTISRDLTKIKDKIVLDFQEVNALSEGGFDISANYQEGLQEIQLRIRVLAGSIERETDQTKTAVKDNLFVELQEIFEVISTEVKIIIKTVSKNLAKTAKGLLGGNSGFRLLLPPGWR
jgi:predicted nuclease with TOPRIM domain